MTGPDRTTAVGQLPTPASGGSRVPATLTRLVWLLWVASLGVLALYYWSDGPWELWGLVAVDGLTVVMWLAVTFFSGIVHSYSRRYMAGNRAIDRFFARTFAFTLVVMVLVAAEHLAVFWAAWLGMGLVMARLVGHVDGWPQAQAAAGLARRYFLASSAALAVALVALWWHTGATTVSGVASAVEAGSAAGTTPATAVLAATGALLLAAMVQSALVPFHMWLLASMT
ncbi:MAG: proton-conducting transporter membrane subunit, partial [Haloarculaceae archaeon]